MRDTIQIGGSSFTQDLSAGSWSEGCWRGEIDLLGWSRDGQSCRAEVQIDSRDPYDESGSPTHHEPSKSQIAALEFFVKNQVQLVAEALAVSLRYLKQFIEIGDPWFHDVLQLEPIETLEDLRQCLGPPSLFVNSQSIDGFAWIGIQSGCAWDEEHAFGLAIWKNAVLNVRQGDAAFSTPYDQGDAIFSEDQKSIRQHVFQMLEEQDE